MKRIVFTILTMNSLLIAGECTAEQYATAISNKDIEFISINSAKEVLTYVDTSTVEKTESHGYKAWTILIDVKSDNYIKSYIEFDKNLKHVRLLSIVGFDCNGSDVERLNQVQPWEVVDKNSMFAVAGKFIKGKLK